MDAAVEPDALDSRPLPGPRAILVLGMHRSGTSAMTRLFNLLGADLPGRLMRPGRDNETGYWESDDLRIVNDEILKANGSSWQDWRVFDETWYRTPEAEQYRRELVGLLKRDFSASSLFALKDPRICRIAPIWLDALQRLGVRPAVVIPIRNPIEVAQSLQERDGFAPVTSYLLWLRHVLDAERATRGLPRVVTSYEALLTDWYCLAGTVALRTRLNWPRSAEDLRGKVEAFIAPRLRHHAVTRDELRADAALVEWVKGAFAIMTRMAQVGEDDTFCARLDGIREEFDTASVALAAIASGGDALSAHHEQELERLTADVDKLKERLAGQNEEIEALSTELDVLRALSGRRALTLQQTSRAPRDWSRFVAPFKAIEKAASPLLRYWPAKRQLEAQEEDIRRSGLFDAAWYQKRYPDVAKFDIDPLEHYLKFGGWEGRDPHPLFDQHWYRVTYPDATKQGHTPLGHFVMIGAAKGYDPNALFHTSWYLATNRDAVTAQVNPLRHYMEHAAERGRNPNPLFDTAWYLKENPDVAESGTNPLVHYIYFGIAELRDPHPLFDTEWYLNQYDQVAASGMDALEHYLTIGAFRGFRPSAAAGAGVRARRAQRAARLEPTSEDNAPRGSLALLQANALEAPPVEALDFSKWQLDLRGKPKPQRTPSGQIGVFIHLFYDNLAQEVAASLLNIPFDFQVYVSTNTEEKKQIIADTFGNVGLAPLIKVVPNRGWDVAPFLIGFNEEVRNHDICLKLHGKQSRFGHPGNRGTLWRRHLLSGLLGSPRLVKGAVDCFGAHPELGVAMVPHWPGIRRGVSDIGPNYLHMQRLLRHAGMSIAPDQPIEFPSGSMFWFRRDALLPLFDLGLSWSDFSRCRPRDLDATIAHAVERCILIFAAKAGFKWAFLPRRRLAMSWPRNRTSHWNKNDFDKRNENQAEVSMLRTPR